MAEQNEQTIVANKTGKKEANMRAIVFLFGALIALRTGIQ